MGLIMTNAVTLDILISVLLLIASYLLGSIPFGLVIGKLVRGIDLREHGSKNIGTTNAFRVLGKKIGSLVFVCDLLKGMIIIILVKILLKTNVWETPIDVFYYGGAAILGHSYSIFLEFKGGKVVATSLGVIFCICPLAAILCLIAFAITFFTTGYVSLASTFATLTVVITTTVLHFINIDNEILQIFMPSTELTVLIFIYIAASLIIFKHRTNYVRLIKGTENSFKKKKA